MLASIIHDWLELKIDYSLWKDHLAANYKVKYKFATQYSSHAPR